MTNILSNAMLEICLRIARLSSVPLSRGSSLVFSLFLLVQLACPTLAADDATTLEYKVKAGFLFNFSKFVEWPGKALGTGQELVLGILADDPAAPIIQQAIDGKMINEHKIRVKVLPKVDELTECQIFFLSRNKKEALDDMLAKADGRPVLTVTEVEVRGARSVINLVRKGETFGFEVNLDSAERSGLQISAKLASVATAVVKTRR